MLQKTSQNGLVTLFGFDDLFRSFDRTLSEIMRIDPTDGEDDWIRNNAVSFTREDDKKFELDFELPGVNLSDIKMDIEDHSLIVSVDQKKESDNRRARYQMTRKMTLPENVSENDISANLKLGVLTVTLPKIEVKKLETKKIKINQE